MYPPLSSSLSEVSGYEGDDQARFCWRSTKITKTSEKSTGDSPVIEATRNTL
jgi:hypothetical protein